MQQANTKQWSVRESGVNPFFSLMVLTPLFCAALPDLYLSYLWATHPSFNVLPRALWSSTAQTSFIFTSWQTHFNSLKLQNVFKKECFATLKCLSLKNVCLACLFSECLVFTGKLWDNHSWRHLFKTIDRGPTSIHYSSIKHIGPRCYTLQKTSVGEVTITLKTEII